MPTQETLTIGVDSRMDLTDEEYKKIVELIGSLEKTEVDLQWLHDEPKSSVKTKRSTTQFLME